MDFKQLQSFVAVVSYGSFSKAANKLFISQPTISSHIRALEEELNYRLIIRTTKSIEVTPYGRDLYNCACNMFALRDGLLERWAMANENIIRLGASTIPTEYMLPELLPAFRRLHPNIQFNIHQNSSHQILLGLLNDEFSLGLVSTVEYKDALEYIPVYEDSMVLITANDDEGRKSANKLNNGASLADILRGSPVILREQQSVSKKSMSSILDNIGVREEELYISARLNHQESIIKLVASGLGISIISKKAAEQSAMRGDILSIPLTGIAKSRMIYLAYRKEYLRSDIVAEFMEFVEDFYK